MCIRDSVFLARVALRCAAFEIELLALVLGIGRRQAAAFVLLHVDIGFRDFLLLLGVLLFLLLGLLLLFVGLFLLLLRVLLRRLFGGDRLLRLALVLLRSLL